MYKRYALYHNEMGVFLGDFLGMAFWSECDPVGQDCAFVFDSIKRVDEFRDTWPETEDGFLILEVETADENYATMDELEKIGIPRWEIN